MTSAIQSRDDVAQTGESCAPIPGERIPALDGIRGIAIILVLVFHITSFGLHEAVSPKLMAITRWGWIGVDLFFVLSGFLITGILQDAKGSKGYFRNFYARRAVRIFPAYYLLLIAVFVTVPLFGRRASEVIQQNSYGPHWIYWSYSSNFYFAYHAHSEGWLGHTWSLAIEEQFYFFWPALVWLCDRRRMIKVCTAIIVGVLVARIILLWQDVSVPSVLRIYFLTFTHMDSLAIGAIAALLLRAPQGIRFARRTGVWLAFAAPAVFVTFYVAKSTQAGIFSVLEEATKFTLLGLWFVSILLLAVTAAPRALINRLLGSAALTFFGSYSYGFYLYHLPLMACINALFPKADSPFDKLLLSIAYLASTILVGLLSWHLFEKQCLKLKRFFPLQRPHAG